jgi:hypothetical protein
MDERREICSLSKEGTIEQAGGVIVKESSSSTGLRFCARL